MTEAILIIVSAILAAAIYQYGFIRGWSSRQESFNSVNRHAQDNFKFAVDLLEKLENRHD